jgi:quinol-cytochrome oxidoreductase complex cytochrome b subunit
VPFLDRSPERSWHKRPLAIFFAALMVAVIVVLTILEAVTTPAEHLGNM